jgi:large subunit ribosomal protein L6
VLRVWAAKLFARFTKGYKAMSRIGKMPVELPSTVTVRLDGEIVHVKGAKGELHHRMHSLVSANIENDILTVGVKDESIEASALSGTTRALLNNMVTGVTVGFEKKLDIVGVGYRAQVQGKKLNLSLGFSHSVVYEIPEGVQIETPSQTEIIVKGIDKQQVGQVAANIRAYREPEPYKGKGVRYSDEIIVKKEAKKA